MLANEPCYSFLNIIAIQFINNGILLLINKKIVTYKLQSVNNFKVINRLLFLQEIKKIFKPNKKTNNYYNISVIIDKTYSNIEKHDIKYLLKLISFKKIEFIDISNILALTKQEIAIDISQKYFKIYLNNNIYILNIYFKEYKELLVLYLNKIIPQNNINKIKLFGNNKNIKDIMSYLNHILDLDIYIYSYSSVFPLNLLT